MNPLTPFFLLAIVIVVGWAIGARLSRQVFIDKAFEEADKLHNQEWSGKKSDELMAWYRVRKRLLSNNRATKAHRQAWMYAVEVRISQCRARNKTFRTVNVAGGKPTVISTQN